MWQVLHGIAFHVTNPDLIEALVGLLGELLPCKFCRESWPQFVDELVTTSGKSVREHVTDGTFPRFMYDAHNMVNDKLMRQRMKEAAATLAPALARELGLSTSDAVVANALCAAAEQTQAYGLLDKRPSFECVAKRYFIADRMPFSNYAVWRALLLFTLNFSADKTHSFIMLLRVLAACVHIIGSADMRRVGDVLVSAADMLAGQASWRSLTQDDVFSTVALAQAACEERMLSTDEERQEYLKNLHTRVEVAAAGVCLNGVCK
jgi:hypothetical protein